MNLFAKIKNKMQELEEIQAYVHYIFDMNKWESELLPLKEIKPILERKKYREVYKLENVAYYLNGKPVFLLVRGIPFSLEIQELDKTLRIKGYSADEIEAKTNSIYINTIFRKGSLQFKDYLVLILTNIITGLMVYILTFMAMMVQNTNNTNNIVNQTVTNATMGV